MSTKLALAAAVGFALPGLEFSGFDPAAPSEQGRKALLCDLRLHSCRNEKCWLFLWFGDFH